MFFFIQVRGEDFSASPGLGKAKLQSIKTNGKYRLGNNRKQVIVPAALYLIMFFEFFRNARELGRSHIPPVSGSFTSSTCKTHFIRLRASVFSMMNL